MSKMIKITMVMVMTFFAVFITPQERASANPLAVGGALYLGGAGVYVAGAVGIAAIAGIAGCESCEQDINEHAQRTWDGSTQLVKDGVQLMVDASVGAWGATSSALTSVDANVNTWIDGEIDGMVDMLLRSTENNFANVTSENFTTSLTKSGTTSKYIRPTKANMAFVAGGAAYKELLVFHSTSSIQFQLRNPVLATSPNVVLLVVSADSYANFQTLYDSIRYQDNTNILMSIVGVYAQEMPVAVGDYAQVLANRANMYTNATEAWEEMTDAGLVLPVDNARPMAGDIPLKYDPVTDTYAGIDGVTVPHSDVTGFEYQKPHWKTLEDLAKLGLTGLGAGLYIDGWVGSDTPTTSVYDPVTDTTTTTTTTTGSTTNVTTGETVTTDAVTTTTTTTGDTTANPAKTPEGTTPKTQTGKSNRWGKLVTTKFPFSLPWDLFFILSFMNAEPIPPVFEVDERILKRENVEGIQIKFAIDLSFLDPYVPWFRRFLVLGFAFFLIMNTRKLLGGAQ